MFFELLLIQVAAGNKRKVPHAVFTLAVFAVCQASLVWQWTPQKRTKKKNPSSASFAGFTFQKVCLKTQSFWTSDTSARCTLHFGLRPLVFLSFQTFGKSTKASVLVGSYSQALWLEAVNKGLKAIFWKLVSLVPLGSDMKKFWNILLTKNHNKTPTFSSVLLKPFCKLLNNSPSSLCNLFCQIQWILDTMQTIAMVTFIKLCTTYKEASVRNTF